MDRSTRARRRRSRVGPRAARADGEVFKLELLGTERCADLDAFKFNARNNLDLWVRIVDDQEWDIAFSPAFGEDETIPVIGITYLARGNKRVFSGAQFQDDAFIALEGTALLDRNGGVKKATGTFNQQFFIELLNGADHDCFSSGKFAHRPSASSSGRASASEGGEKPPRACSNRTRMKLLTMAGALRQGSLNKQLLNLASKLLQAAGAELDPVDFRALAIPIYDGDVETSTGLPPGALELAARVTAADGLVIASPEYNMSMPALLKNAIDWLSRAKPMPLRGKTALLMSASPSLVGGNRALWALRMPLEVLGVHVYPDMFSLATAHQAFKPDGELVDEALARFLRRVVDGFVRMAGALQTDKKTEKKS